MNILMLTSPRDASLKNVFFETKIHLGVGYIVSYLESRGHTVTFLDLYYREQELPDITNFDFVGIHSTTITARSTMAILEQLSGFRKNGWKGKIVVGGPHASIMPGYFPDYVDFIVQGEGEYAAADVVEGRVQERIVRYPRIKNLDKLPRTAYHHFKEIPYSRWDVALLGAQPIATMNTSRGCPYSCTFCSVGSIWGKHYTYHSVERICDDIDYLMTDFGIKGIFFREDNFTLRKERTIRFSEYLIKKRFNIKWMCETRADSLSLELLKIMRNSGCTCIYLGIEAGTQKMLDKLKKGITIEQVKTCARWCHDLQMRFHMSFITGTPGETEEDRAEIENLILETAPTSYRVDRYRGYPGSAIYEQLVKNGRFSTMSPEGLLDVEKW